MVSLVIIFLPGVKLIQLSAINYYAPFVFDGLVGGNTTNLLATGVVGIIEFVFTIPAVLYVDHFGRKTILIAGAVGMASCHFIVAGIIGAYGDNWPEHRAGGWAAIVFVWVFIANFAYSWGPVAWIVASEVFPLSMRAKGVSLGGSANWLNNFAVGLSTSPFIKASNFGTFIFFGCITTVAIIWVILLVPETKGRTLEEMVSPDKSDLVKLMSTADAYCSRRTSSSARVALLPLIWR